RTKPRRFNLEAVMCSCGDLGRGVARLTFAGQSRIQKQAVGYPISYLLRVDVLVSSPDSKCRYAGWDSLWHLVGYRGRIDCAAGADHLERTANTAHDRRPSTNYGRCVPSRTRLTFTSP